MVRPLQGWPEVSSHRENRKHTHTHTQMYAEKCTHKYIHLNIYASYTKRQETQTLCNYTETLQSTPDTLQLYTNVVVNSMPSLRSVEGTKLQLLVNSIQKQQKNDKHSQGGERDHNRGNTTNLRLHLNSCTIMHVCVK